MFTMRLLLLLLGSNVLAQAYPSFFAYRSRGPQYSACMAHPDQAYGPHLAPIWDNTITFIVLDSSGKPVSSWCPGRTYTIKVSWPEAPPATATSRPVAEPARWPPLAQRTPSPPPPPAAEGSPSPNQTVLSPVVDMSGTPPNATEGPEATNSSALPSPVADMAGSMASSSAAQSQLMDVPLQMNGGRRRLASVQAAGDGPIGRYMLITATQGIFPKTGDQECNHRQWFDYSNTPEPEPSYSGITMKATCWASTGNSMVLKVTTCQGPGFHFRQAYLSIPAAKNCKPDPVLCPPSSQLPRQRSSPPPSRSVGPAIRAAIRGAAQRPGAINDAISGVINDVITGVINDG